MKEEIKEYCRNRFKKHRATIISRDSNFFIMDWKQDGTIAYSIRYILDIGTGTLTLYGDLGASVARWFNRVTPEQLYRYIGTEDYYIEKIVSASHVFTYMFEDIKEDLERIRDGFLEDTMESETQLREDIREDFDEILTICGNTMFTETTPLPEDMVEICEKYSDSVYDDFGNIGKRIDSRVYLWIEGYRMACEQLGIVANGGSHED